MLLVLLVLLVLGVLVVGELRLVLRMQGVLLVGVSGEWCVRGQWGRGDVVMGGERRQRRRSAVDAVRVQHRVGGLLGLSSGLLLRGRRGLSPFGGLLLLLHEHR